MASVGPSLIDPIAAFEVALDKADRRMLEAKSLRTTPHVR
jgi:hypothetical protein